MFNVIRKPFPVELGVVGEDVFAVLIFEEIGKPPQILVGSIAQGEALQAEVYARLELTAAFLETAPTVEDKQEMLLSIQETWMQADAQRARAVEAVRRQYPPREHFGADFGRLDLSPPGRGGTGVDGYW